MARNHMAQFLSYLQSDDTKFQIAHRPFFLVEFSFPNGTPRFERYGNGNVRYKRDELPFLVQGVDLPKLSISGGNSEGEGYSIVNYEGQAKGPGKFIVLPDGAKSIDIKFLDTETPVFENYFYPWLNEVTAFKYQSKDRPFSRATIYVDLLSNDYTRIVQTYKILGAYPHAIELPELKQASGSTPVRSVTFDFNNIKIEGGTRDTIDHEKILPPQMVKRITRTIEGPLGETIDRTVDNAIKSIADDPFKIERPQSTSQSNYYGSPSF